jgi:hypothetical protein
MGVVLWGFLEAVVLFRISETEVALRWALQRSCRVSVGRGAEIVRGVSADVAISDADGNNEGMLRALGRCQSCG